MINKLPVLAITILIVLISTPTFAGQKYISGFAGVNFPSGSDVKITGLLPADIIREEKYDSNITFGGAFGYDFGNDIRIEEEFSYRNNDVDLASFPSGPGLQGIEKTTISLMTNGYYDIDLGIPLKPYLGMGIGFASIEREVSLAAGVDSDRDVVLAYQLMAGLGYKISPKFTITAGYRYFVTSKSQFFLNTPPGTPTVADDEFQSHEFIGGIRFSF